MVVIFLLSCFEVLSFQKYNPMDFYFSQYVASKHASKSPLQRLNRSGATFRHSDACSTYWIEYCF